MTRWLAGTIGLVLVGLILWLLFSRTEENGNNDVESVKELEGALKSEAIEKTAPNEPPSADEEMAAKAQALFDAYHSSIDFWGKIVDETGEPIPGASVNFTLNNHPERDGAYLQTTSDSEGLFNLTGKTGASLFVAVDKEGYYQTKKSSGSFKYYQLKQTNKNLPKELSPAIFVLKRKGEVAKLIKLDYLRIKLKPDGSETFIDLEDGTQSGKRHLIVQCQIENEGSSKSRYKWSCSITVPGGGLLKREDGLNFLAPENGYIQSEEITIDADANNWSESLDRSYFIKLSSGNYARAELTIYGRKKPYLVLTSYLNPNAGDRNLEYGRGSQIK